MSDVYKNLGTIISYEEKELSPGKTPVLKLKFKRPNSATPDKELSYNVKGQFVDKIEDALLEKVYGVSSGEQVCVHVGKDDNGYPLVIDITDAKDATDGRKSGGNFQYKKGGFNSPRDSSGIAVGAAWTNAIEILKAGLDIEDVKKMVEDILKIKLAQEERLKASTKTKADAQAETIEKVMTKAEEIKARAEAKKKSAQTKVVPKVDEEDLIDDNLDDVDFGEEGTE